MDAKLRKVYHERPVVPETLTPVPESIKYNTEQLKQLPPIRDKSDSISDSSTPKAIISSRGIGFAELLLLATQMTAPDNFVRLNLKRHLNVKRHFHRAYTPVDTLPDSSQTNRLEVEEETTQHQQEQSGSGPGMLEEEVVQVVLEKQKKIPQSSDTTPSNAAAPEDANPLCSHGLPTVLRTVRKSGKNNGRQFYCCPLERNRSCHFFLWKDNNRGDIMNLITHLTLEEPSHQDSKEATLKYLKEELKEWSVDMIGMIEA